MKRITTRMKLNYLIATVEQRGGLYDEDTGKVIHSEADIESAIKQMRRPAPRKEDAK